VIAEIVDEIDLSPDQVCVPAAAVTDPEND